MTVAANPGAHVVVFGIDGVRYDTLCQARTPQLDTIAAAGFLAPVRVNQAGPTISGPCWATIATGVLAPEHNIHSNMLHGHRIGQHPDFLTRVRAALPDRVTYAAADWPPLLCQASGGPILLGGGYCPVDVDADPAADPAAWAFAEEYIAADAAKTLGSTDVAASFVYLGAPDVIAHREGVTSTYLAAVEHADELIGQVLTAITARPGYRDERWTVLAVTDHGHLDAGGHGGDTDAERTAWLAAAGPEVPDEPPAELEQADVAAQVLRALDIDIDPDWRLTGRPLDRAAATPPAGRL